MVKSMTTPIIMLATLEATVSKPANTRRAPMKLLPRYPAGSVQHEAPPFIFVRPPEIITSKWLANGYLEVCGPLVLSSVTHLDLDRSRQTERVLRYYMVKCWGQLGVRDTRNGEVRSPASSSSVRELVLYCRIVVSLFASKRLARPTLDNSHHSDRP